MNEWLKNLAGYLLVISVAVQMLPHQKYEQYVRLFTGFLLIIFVMQPLLKIGSADSFLEDKIYTFLQEQEELENQILQQGAWFEQQQLETDAQRIIEIEPVENIEVEVRTGE